MKDFAKPPFAIVMMAFALACAPAALADTVYSFNFTTAASAYAPSSFYAASPTAANGTFVSFSGAEFITGGNAPGTDGVYVTSMTGTYTDTADGVSGTMSLVPLNAPPVSPTNALPDNSPDGLFQYDNVFYPNADAPGTTGGGILDSEGLLLYVTPSTCPVSNCTDYYEVNFYADSPTTYSLLEAVTGGNNNSYLDDASGLGQENNMDDGGPIYTPDPLTPEPSSLLLFGTGSMGLALMAFRRAKAVAKI